MIRAMKEVYAKSRDQWRKWLGRNHDKSSGVWLIFYKKDSGKATVEYDAAVEEALCFGWIDSIIKKVDDERYKRKFTPRRTGSRWSELNKKRVGKLIKQGRMTEAGLLRVEKAKESGRWCEPGRPEISFDIPAELEAGLAKNKNKKARAFFERLAPTYRRQFIGWISVAKRQDTRDRRVKEAIASLERGKKLGLK